MKNYLYRLSLLAFVIFLFFPQIAKTQQPIELKWASPYPVGHPSYVMAVEFIDLIHKHTNNKIKISHFPAEQLGKAKDLLIICSQGIADIAQIHITYFAGQLPLNNVAQLPFYITASEGSKIYRTLIARSPEIQQEFAKYGVKALEGHTTMQYEVATIKKPVHRVEDLKGLKLKTAGGMYDKIARRYGIIPVSIAAAETYEAMQRGIVEGCVFNFPSIRSYRLNDHIKYITNGMKCGGYPGAVIFNQKKWEKITPELQQGILKAAEEAGRRWGIYWDEMLVETIKEFSKQGIQIYNIPAQDRTKWDAPLKGIEEEYIKDLEKKNLPGRKVFNDFMKIVNEVIK
uniref:TRAP transporter substrate-binding protein n=1 Tax=candidate division CPR3 bacterium TaxID=2268181 RepID=A0A7V3N4X7_UNCC3